MTQDALRQFWDICDLEINDELVFWDRNKVSDISQRRYDLGWRWGRWI